MVWYQFLILYILQKNFYTISKANVINVRRITTRKNDQNY